MSDQVEAMLSQSTDRPLPTKYLVFAAIVVMGAYVLYHNEYFLIVWSAPVWKHYEPIKW